MTEPEHEFFSDTRLRDMLQAKYGKPNYQTIDGSGEYGKGFNKGYNLGYDDGSRHAWEEAKTIIQQVVQYYVSKK